MGASGADSSYEPCHPRCESFFDLRGTRQIQRGRARPFAERALETLRQAGQETDVAYWRLAGNLALIYRLGDFPAADALYRDSIAGLESALGNDYPHLGVLLGEYAQLLRKTGGKAEAKGLERRAKAVLANAHLPGRYTINARTLTR